MTILKKENKIEIKKSEDEIKDLLQKAATGNEQAFAILMKEYNSLVIKVIEQTLTINNFHTILSINYKSTSEELASSVWLTMYNKFQKKALFKASILFVAYISIVSRNIAKKFMRARIDIRKPEEGIEKEYLPDISDDQKEDEESKNFKFESINDFFDEDLGTSPDDCIEQVILEEQYHNELLKVLTEREKQVLRLTLSDYSQDYIAKEIGKTIKTVYNDMKKINEKSRNLMK